MHEKMPEGIRKRSVVPLVSLDWDKLLPLLEYLKNNTSETQKRADLADNYDVVAKKLRTPYRKIPEGDIPWLIGQYENGAKVKDLSAKYGCARHCVRYTLAKHGVRPRR